MGFTINWFEVVDSTNNQAVSHFSKLKNFSVYAAKFQSGGRGQRGSGWESEAGKNLLFSLIIKESGVEPHNQFVISQIISLALRRYLKGKGVEAKVKWPNDIYIGEKKVCGILIEHFLMGDTLSGSVIGVGLNLNQERFLSNAPNPVSVKLVTGEEYSLESELIELLDHFKALYSALLSDREATYEKVSKEYFNALYRAGEFHCYEEMVDEATLDGVAKKGEKGRVIEAKIVEVKRDGTLLLEQRSGVVKGYQFKEVKYL